MKESKRARRRSRGVGFGRRVESEHSAVLDGRLVIWDGEGAGYITHYEGAECLLLGRLCTEMMRFSTLSGLTNIVQTLAYIACAC